MGTSSPIVMEISRNLPRHADIALPHSASLRFFVANDQPLAAAIPAAHDTADKFSTAGLNPLLGIGVVC